MSSLTILEKVEQSLEKFEELIGTFMTEAVEGKERHASARCVAMLIKHHGDLRTALTVPCKDRESGEKDVMAATSSVVIYLGSSVVQVFLQSPLKPFTNPDGTVTEAASKHELFMYYSCCLWLRNMGHLLLG